jgi:Glycosyl hydrolase catalytic core
MVPLREEKGKKIVGPGCASDPGGEAWLDEFMRRVQELGEPPDYLGLHYYGPEGASAIQYIEKMYIS